MGDKNTKVCQFWDRGFMTKNEEKVKKLSFLAQHNFKQNLNI